MFVRLWNPWHRSTVTVSESVTRENFVTIPISNDHLQVPGFFSSMSRAFPPEINAMGSNFFFYIMALTVGYALISNVQVCQDAVYAFESPLGTGTDVRACCM